MRRYILTCERRISDEDNIARVLKIIEPFVCIRECRLVESTSLFPPDPTKVTWLGRNDDIEEAEHVRAAMHADGSGI
jgi:hypothetical protein